MGIDFRRPRHIRGFRLGEVLVWDFTSKSLVEKTVSGSIVTFSDGADDVPLKSCAVTIAPTLDGVSSVDVVQTGANLFNEDWEVGGINDTTGLPNSDTNKIRSKTFSIIKGGTTCYVSVPQPIRVLFYASDESFISETANIRNNSFSVPSNCSFFKIRGTVDYGITYNNDIMISYGSTATAYTPYVTPTTHTANLGRTIHGGSVDVVNGTGKSTHKIYTATDVTGLYWNNRKADQVDNNHRATFRIAITSGYITQANSLCNDLTYSANITGGSGYTEGYQIVSTAGIYFCIDLADIGMSSATSDTPNQDFLDAIHEYGDNLKFSIELTTPEDFTFTPVPILSRLGDNTMWSDDGDLEVIYYAYAD